LGKGSSSQNPEELAGACWSIGCQTKSGRCYCESEEEWPVGLNESGQSFPGRIA